MDSYPQWQQNKQYQGHITRLRDITIHRSSTSSSRKRISNKFKISSKNHQNRQKINKTQTDVQKQRQRSPIRIKTLKNNTVRLYTQPILSHKQMLRSPIPLVSANQGQLIKSALNAKNISLKEKQQLLENYLLSKRILQTKSVIKPEQFRKQFKFHKKVSRTMSKLKNMSNYSQQRHQNFLRYEKQMQKIKRNQFGQGRNSFTFQLRDVLLIKGILLNHPQVAYNLKLHVGRNSHQIRALTHFDLFHKAIKINFKKSLLINSPEIVIHLSMMRENHEQEIGIFKPAIGDFQYRCIKVYKICRGKFPVGTVQIKGEVEYYSKNRAQTERVENFERYEKQQHNFLSRNV